MKSLKRVLPSVTALTVAMLAATSTVNAATKPAQVLEFTKTTATQNVTVKPDSFYNLTMGYKGWTHHSAWGYMKLTKGKPVTITAKSASADTAKKEALHPGIAVWSAPQKKGKYLDIAYNPDHFYQQWTNVLEKDPKDDDDNVVKGLLKWDFITNGFDRDGMEGIKVTEDGQAVKTDLGVLPAKYDQSFVNRIQDGKIGELSVTFVPPVTGVYKFVVGGVNPGTALLKQDGTVNRTDEPVEVTVAFPE